MKLLNALLNEKYARKAAVVLQWACYVVMVFFVLTLVLACLGRQTFALNTGTGFYENAIYAGQDHEWRSAALPSTLATISSSPQTTGDQIDLATHIGLSLMFAAQSLPTLAMYWLLSRVFANVCAGECFYRAKRPLPAWVRFAAIVSGGLPSIFKTADLPFDQPCLGQPDRTVDGRGDA